MQILISKFSAAAHLALLAVAPLLISLFAFVDLPCIAILWLSLFAAIWLLMSPSCFRNERPSQARSRVIRAIAFDPLFWFLSLALVYAALLSFNTGVSVRYDAEELRWLIAAPKISWLSGSTGSCGLIPLVTTFALGVVVMGVRHSLGREARAFFCLSGSVLSGVLALIFLLVSFQYENRLWAVDFSSLSDSFFVGFAFGIWSLVSLIAVFDGITRFGFRVTGLSGFALASNLSGLAFFSYPAMAFFFLLAATGMTIGLAVLKKGEIPAARRMIPVFVFLFAVFLAVVVVIAAGSDSPVALKWVGVFSASSFPSDFMAVRQSLAGACAEAWKDCSWSGAGLGSMRYIIRFYLPESAWTLVPNTQGISLNFWWQLLAEQGIVGLAFSLFPVFYLATDWVRRVSRTGRDAWRRPLVWLLPIVLASMAFSFFDNTCALPGVAVAQFAALALSTAAMPVHFATGDSV